MKNIKIDLIVLVEKQAKDLGLDKKSTKYIVHRVSHEGVSFLTKTLPILSKSVLKSIELGFFDRPSDFKWKGAHLELCQDWLKLIFDSRGVLRPDACPYALKSIRQLCEYLYKLVLPFTEDDVKEAEAKYVDLEENFPKVDHAWSNDVRITFENLYPRISSATVDDVFLAHSSRFGPGMFAGSTKVDTPAHIYKNRCEMEIGTTSTVYRAHTGAFKPYPSSRTINYFVNEEKTSEVVIVPKDSRGPRIISKEPLHLLRGQMAFFDWLSKNLERSSNKRINFADQTINQRLAREGSLKQNYATLDLKDASDRVGYSFARAVFVNSPAIRWFVTNARSTHTILPYSRKKIRLNKLSGMGSGLTFPVMALLIQCSVVTSVKKRFPALSYKDIARYVYVYGDDIIVPSRWYSLAERGLVASGLKVNIEKSYVRSHFRESCGMDYLHGISVGPTRLKISSNRSKLRIQTKTRGIFSPLRQNPTTSMFIISGDEACMQLERHCRELVAGGMINTACYFYRLIEKHTNIELVPVSGDSPVLGRWESSAPVPTFESTEAFIPAAVIDRDNKLCPYKYLGRFFKKRDDDIVSYIYGELTRPREIQLVKRAVTYLQTVINSSL